MNEHKQTKSNQNLSAKQLSAIPILIEEPSISRAAERIGLGRTQIHEWLKDPNFKEELETQRKLCIDEAIGVLKSNMTKAAGVLAGLLDSENETIQRGVANDILDKAMKFIEIQEFEERLTRLEGAQR